MSSQIKWYASWRKKAANALLALVPSGAGVLALAGPAAAAPSDCGLGLHCTYSGYNYGNDAWQQPSTHTGTRIAFERGMGTPDLGARNFNDTAESGYFESNLSRARSILCR